MRKQVSVQKCYNSNYKNELNRITEERFNDYGYNMDFPERASTSIDQTSCKTGPNCLGRHLNSEKR